MLPMWQQVKTTWHLCTTVWEITTKSKNFTTLMLFRELFCECHSDLVTGYNVIQ